MDWFEIIGCGRVLFTTPEKRAVHFGAAAHDPMGWAQRQTNSNVYFSCAHTGLGRNGGRGGVEETTGISMLWLDLDIAGDAHKSERCPTEEQARQILAAYPVPPSIIVHSGHGWHCYWLLSHDFMWMAIGSAHKLERRQRAANLLRGWQAIAQRASAAIGCHVDSTHDLARVLRVPGTFNLKNGQRLPVRIIDENCARYDIDMLEQAAPRVAAEPVASSRPRANRAAKSQPAPVWDDADDFDTFLLELREVVAG